MHIKNINNDNYYCYSVVDDDDDDAIIAIYVDYCVYNVLQNYLPIESFSTMVKNMSNIYFNNLYNF